MTLPKIPLALMTIVLTAAIIWASLDSHVFEGVRWITGQPWGVTTLIDVYCAFTLLGCYMGWRERSVTRGILLTAATYLLGSLVPLVYLMVRRGAPS